MLILCLQELVATYVSVLRWLMVCVAVFVLLCVSLRYTDPVQQNLQLLQQLREMQIGLQEALQHAGEFSLDTHTHTHTQFSMTHCRCVHLCVCAASLGQQQQWQQQRRKKKWMEVEDKEDEEKQEEEEKPDMKSHHQLLMTSLPVSSSGADVTLQSNSIRNTSASPGRRFRHTFCSSPSSPLTYNIHVDDKQVLLFSSVLTAQSV